MNSGINTGVFWRWVLSACIMGWGLIKVTSMSLINAPHMDLNQERRKVDLYQENQDSSYNLQPNQTVQNTEF